MSHGNKVRDVHMIEFVIFRCAPSSETVYICRDKYICIYILMYTYHMCELSMLVGVSVEKAYTFSLMSTYTYTCICIYVYIHIHIHNMHVFMYVYNFIYFGLSRSFSRLCVVCLFLPTCKNR